MFIEPDTLTVVADQNHSMYNRMGWLDETFIDSETGVVISNWVHLNGEEYDLPEYRQLITFEDAIQGRIGNLLTGGDFHLSVGKDIYESVLNEQIKVRVRPELTNLDPQQLKTLAEAMFSIFSKS